MFTASRLESGGEQCIVQSSQSALDSTSPKVTRASWALRLCCCAQLDDPPTYMVELCNTIRLALCKAQTGSLRCCYPAACSAAGVHRSPERMDGALRIGLLYISSPGRHCTLLQALDRLMLPFLEDDIINKDDLGQNTAVAV